MSTETISTTGAGTIAGATETPVALYAVGVGGAQPFDLRALWLWSSFAMRGAMTGAGIFSCLPGVDIPDDHYAVIDCCPANR
jgi:hypothetical protein